MSVESILPIIIAFATAIGTAIGAGIGAFLRSRTNKRLGEQSQRMTIIQDDTAALKKRLSELEADKTLLEEGRAARDRRISDLEQQQTETAAQVVTLEHNVKTLTDEKARVITERDELKSKLTSAEAMISNLNLRVITLEAQLHAEQAVGARVVQPIVDALARLAAPALAVALPPADAPADAA